MQFFRVNQKQSCLNPSIRQSVEKRQMFQKFSLQEIAAVVMFFVA
jgi:hypothetical protein